MDSRNPADGHRADRKLQLGRLSSSQLGALRHVEALSARRSSRARDTLSGILRQADLEEAVLDEAMQAIRDHARVVLHFHPDRLDREGHSVVESFLQEGLYRSQFETGLSSGSLTAFPGGERDSWEERLFGGAYQAPGVSLAERPKYGALELVRYADGPAPRFGSCYLVLHRAVSERCSFTFGGSQSPLALEHSGTLAALDCVMAALLEEVAKDGGALGINDITVAGFLARLPNELSSQYPSPAARRVGRSLDSFIEAQVHGAVELESDVEWLVADPAFQGTLIEGQLVSICSRYHIALDWHPGFVLPVSKVPDDFRGPAMPPLARRIAGDGILDVAKIGRSAVSLRLEPESWQDWGTYAETLQYLKQLWHVLVQYGAPKGSIG
jgi:hypothetical protein